jgi:hypothetical protein
MATPFYRCVAGLIGLLLVGQPAPAEGPSRAKLAKAGKAATALVKGQFRGAQGSAFCIHPAGIFLTNEHVIQQESNVSLVLNPGLRTVKVMPAKVLRVDSGRDLALLQVEGQKDLPTLPLALGDSLSETDELIAFGFPFGEALAADPREYPAISVNVGKVTSLREKGGQLHRIQVDAALNPGNSGGPLLDKDGKVVGVVVSGVRNTGVYFAVPASHIARFISRPELFFNPPSLTLAALHSELEFQARALELVPTAKRLDLELRIQTGPRSGRTFPMAGKEGVYRVRAVPVPAPKGQRVLGLTALFPQGSVSGQVEDRTFAVGGTKVRLSEVRRLVLAPAPRAWDHRGKVLRGEVTGVGSVPVRLGTASVRLDLAKAREIRLRPPEGLSALTGTVVARRDGKEVARLTRFLTVEGVPQAGEEELFLDLDVAPLEKDTVVRKLDVPIRDLAVGGGGRYLILHLPKIRKLAIFDVNRAKVVKHLPAPDPDLKLTAGLEKLVVALPGSRTLQRWDLKSFELDVTVPYPAKGEIIALSLGAASRGPVVVAGKDANNPWPALYLLGLDKLEHREIGWAAAGNRHPFFGPALHVRSSPDGKGTGIWSSSVSPSGVTWIRWDGQIARSSYYHSSNGHIIPGRGGKVLFTGQGMYTEIAMIAHQGKTYPGTDAAGRYLPAYDPAYYVYLGTGPTFNNPNPRSAFVIHKFGMDRPVLSLSGIDVPNDQGGMGRPVFRPGPNQQAAAPSDFTLDKRFHLIPQAKLLIVIPPSNDQLVLHRVDLEAALEKMAAEKK